MGFVSYLEDMRERFAEYDPIFCGIGSKITAATDKPQLDRAKRALQDQRRRLATMASQFWRDVDHVLTYASNPDIDVSYECNELRKEVLRLREQLAKQTTKKNKKIKKKKRRRKQRPPVSNPATKQPKPKRAIAVSKLLAAKAENATLSGGLDRQT